MKTLALAAFTFIAVDGDTLWANGYRIRLWGIDAAERETYAGRVATRTLAEITRGKPLVCIPHGRDRFGRVVARCFVHNQDIACLMLKAGQAREVAYYSNGYYRRRRCVVSK